MADYVQDPNDSKKQVPGTPPDNYYDRISTAAPYSMSKTPNYVLVTSNFTNTAGFFFGSSASFALKEAGAHVHVTASTSYQTWGGEATLNEGDKLEFAVFLK